MALTKCKCLQPSIVQTGYHWVTNDTKAPFSLKWNWMKQKLSICYAAKIEIIENRRTSLQASSICSKLLCNAIFRLLSGRHSWHLLRLLIHPPLLLLVTSHTLLLLVTYFSRVDLLHQYYPWLWTRGTEFNFFVSGAVTRISAMELHLFSPRSSQSPFPFSSLSSHPSFPLLDQPSS